VDSVKKIRTFIALKPPENWIEQLNRIATELKRELRSNEVKWVQPEQIHITLRFLGYIFPDQLPAVVEGLNRSARDTEPFILRGSALGCFPTVRRARVLWLGIEDQGQRCGELRRSITDETSAVGEPREDRVFTPHLTLARIGHLERSEVSVLERLVKRPVEISTDWKVSEVLLMQSHLLSAGAQYDVLHRGPFGLQGHTL
jgi:RNA 2',3'-cyclic 3'-phosphodiesterase